MKAIERRVVALERYRGRSRLTLDHLSTEDLEGMEQRLANGILNLDADDVHFFQRVGFVPDLIPGAGLLRDWLLADELAQWDDDHA